MKDYFGYQNKNVVVTGASSGMGKATAEMLVDLGAKVYALDWNECDVKGIKQYVHVDLSKKESIDQAMKELPSHIDSYFGIAGVSGMKNDFMTTVSIDFIANKYICEEYLIHAMSENGTIAFMTSTGGNGWEKEENKKYPRRTFSKEADKNLNQLLKKAEAKRLEFKKKGIRAEVFREEPFTMAQDDLDFHVYLLIWQNGWHKKRVRVEEIK